MKVPNPNHGIFNVTVSGLEQENMVLKIFNTQGKELFTYQIGDLNGEYNNQVNMSTLPDGIYFINIQNGKVSKTEKLVIY